MAYSEAYENNKPTVRGSFSDNMTIIVVSTLLASGAIPMVFGIFIGIPVCIMTGVDMGIIGSIMRVMGFIGLPVGFITGLVFAIKNRREANDKRRENEKDVGREC